MLGIRLDQADEQMLVRHSRASGRSKSALARRWIKEGLERESDDARIRRAAELIAAHEADLMGRKAGAATDAFLQALDELDGGYDWGPKGPPS